jgi:hypothetical protein
MHSPKLPRAARGGYTLMELSVSLAAASLLVAGVGSTIYVASRSEDSASRDATSVVNGSMTAEQIATELQYATSFTERSANATEFTIADRDGDGAAETVRFSWSGVPGEPLLRSYNGGAPEPMAENVHQFDLSYRLQTATTTIEGEAEGTPSAETLLASFDGWSGITPTNQDLQLSPGSWMSECFSIDWPTGANDLRITRVRLQLWQAGTTGQFTVGIYPASGGAGPLPTATASGSEVVVSCATLPTSADWIDVEFNDVTLSDPASNYNIVVKGVSVGGRIRYLRSLSAPVDATVAKWTLTSGSSWNPSASLEKSYDVPFYLYGTYTATETAEETQDRYFVRSVGIALQVNSDAAARVDTAAEVLNAPEVAEP